MPTMPGLDLLLHNKPLKGAMDRLAARHDRPLPPATARELELVRDLRREVEEIGLPPAGDDQPSEIVWRSFMERFFEAVRREDPRAFLRWPVIRKAMFVSNQPYLALELLFLRSRRDWARRWRPALRESATGHPPPFWALPSSSGNLIHHAHHLAQYELRTGRPAAAFPAVFEFGGGYGSMCRLFHQLGFAGRYVIYDLRPFSALQSFFLGSLGLPLLPPGRLPAAGGGVVCVSDAGALDEALAWAGLGRALFVGTWSISETPAHVRERIMPKVAGCDGVLIAYMRNFLEMDNHGLFTAWSAEHPEFAWSQRGIRTLPGHYYLFGARPRGRG